MVPSSSAETSWALGAAASLRQGLNKTCAQVRALASVLGLSGCGRPASWKWGGACVGALELTEAVCLQDPGQEKSSHFQGTLA